MCTCVRINIQEFGIGESIKNACFASFSSQSIFLVYESIAILHQTI